MMISRVAESCFWLNRYLERVEGFARFLAVNQAFVLDVRLGETERWRPMLIAAGEEKSYLGIHGKAALDDDETVTEYLTWSDASAGSIRSALYWARENARTIRETISLEMWETVNAAWIWLNSKEARGMYRRERDAFFRQLRDQVVLYQGHAQSTMLHEEPLDFMALGTAMERVSLTTRALDVKYHALGPTRMENETPGEAAQWMAILRSCSASEPFFKRNGAGLGGPNVAGFLLLDPHFPRAVTFNLQAAVDCLARIRGQGRNKPGGQSWEALCALRDDVSALTIETVLERGIHSVLTWIVDSAAEVCDTIHRDYFDPTNTARRLAG